MLSVVIPIYNEEKMVKKTLSELKEILSSLKVEHEIITVNDASSDDSGAQLDSIKGITVIHNRINHGYGASLKRGFAASNGEKILILDADGTYPLDKIPELFDQAQDYQMVIGQREQKNDNVLRTIAKNILKLFALILTGTWIPDLNSGLRIFDRELVNRFQHLFPSRFSLTTTLTLAAITCDYDVLFHPIPYYKRVGSSSIKPWAFFQFTGLLFRIIMYFRPLRFFIGPGLLLFIGGCVHAGIQIYQTRGLGEMPVILIVGGFQICFLGLLADLIVKARH